MSIARNIMSVYLYRARVEYRIDQHDQQNEYKRLVHQALGGASYQSGYYQQRKYGQRARIENYHYYITWYSHNNSLLFAPRERQRIINIKIISQNFHAFNMGFEIFFAFLQQIFPRRGKTRPHLRTGLRVHGF